MYGFRRFVVVFSLCLTLSFSALTGCTGQQLTAEERVNDYTYLCSMLDQNYPYFGILQRQHNFDWRKHQEDYESAVLSTKNDSQFIRVIGDFLRGFKQGHTSLVTPEVYPWFLAAYSPENLESYGTEIVEMFKPWILALREEKVQERYATWRPSRAQANSPTLQNMPSGLKIEILEESRIAYLAVKSFVHHNIETDAPTILSFYERIKEYPHLIIDIRGNGGGSDNYWMNNIMGPLIGEPLVLERYRFIRGGDLSAGILAADQLGPTNTLLTSLEIPVPSEVESDFAYGIKSTSRIEPVNSVGFKGEIYLLVDEGVFSAAEGFAAFASASGWATLVGRPTRGDGMSIDPILLALPNSGLLVQFPIILALNPDGSANAEVGTIPHILVPTYEDPLQEVLDIIG